MEVRLVSSTPLSGTRLFGVLALREGEQVEALQKAEDAQSFLHTISVIALVLRDLFAV